MKNVYLFGNWKMYLDYEESIAWAHTLSERVSDIASHIVPALFPSAIAFKDVAETLRATPYALGAQHACWVDRGAYTGEVAIETYRKLGARYVLVGHSERRHIFHETNHEVRLQVDATLASGLCPVVCVGETRDERDKGIADESIEAQVRAACTGLAVTQETDLIIAYEPVWAIHAGQACDPREANRVHTLIKRLVNGLVGVADVAVVYGGSVNEQNMSGFLAQESVNGLLVGGASIKESTWFELVSRA